MLLLAIMLAGCFQSSSVNRSTPHVSYDRSGDVTMYRTPQIRLTQEVHLTRYPIILTISGGCEGEDTHCRPDHVLWDFDAPPEYTQIFGTESIDFI